MRKQKYTTVVINGRSFLKKLVILLLVIAALLFLLPKISNKSNETMGSAEVYAQDIFMPVREAFFSVCRAVLTFDIRDARSVVYAEMPVVEMLNQSGIAGLTNGRRENAGVPEPEMDNAQDIVELLPEDMRPIKEISSPANTTGAPIRNETRYSLNTDELTSQKQPMDLSLKGPKILIIHSHATEAFSEEGKNFYDIKKGDRSQDVNVNVVRVGTEMTKVLNDAGIETIHDTELHDYPSFNGSYASSLEAMTRYKEQYPSIQMVIDVHRDAIIYEDGTKVKAATDIDGKKTAQIMLVIGTNDGGLQHSGWKDNLSFALQYEAFVLKKYPSLMRNVNVRKERFNQHVTPRSMIMEVGTNGNTLEEAVLAGKYAAGMLAEFLKVNYE